MQSATETTNKQEVTLTLEAPCTATTNIDSQWSMFIIVLNGNYFDTLRYIRLIMLKLYTFL